MQDDGFQREWQQHSVLFLRALSLGTIPKSSFEQVLQFLRSACHDAQCPDFLVTVISCFDVLSFLDPS